ncbi:MAG: Smr/MutS family protein, partial [Caldimicrobium sp.]
NKKFSIAMVKNYKLYYGYIGESHAFELAKKLGFDEAILEKAKIFLKDKCFYEYYEKYLSEVQKLETLRVDLEKKHQELENEKRLLAEYKEKLQREYERKWESLLNTWHLEFKKLLESLKESSEGKAKRAYQKFLKEKEIPFIEEDLKFKKGDRVYISFLQKEGIIERVKEKSAEVAIGQIKLDVPLYQLKKRENYSSPSKNLYIPQFSTSGDESKSEKIVLIGEDVESALFLLERKLNECFLKKKRIILVVHGHGSGKLRSVIRDYLKGHPLVERLEEPPLYEGGSGATKIYLYEKN